MLRKMLSLGFRFPYLNRWQSNLWDPCAQFDGRLAERRRIARDLHDTALQDFCIATLQLDVAMEHIPQNSLAKPSLCNCLHLMRRGIDEIRKTLQGLRMQESENNDLIEALQRIPAEFGAASQFDVSFVVLGHARQLNPVVREEVYRIGHEALVNAFLHSGAKRIEIELEFAAKSLRLVVRDDGSGMDAQQVFANLEEHLGLQGMHERAQRLGAKLSVWSKVAAGTEIALSVPNRLAFKPATEDLPLQTRE